MTSVSSETPKLFYIPNYNFKNMKGLSRYRRVLKYIDQLEEENPKKNKKEIKDLHQKLKHTGLKLRTLETARIITFVLLYSSITSAVISVVPGFENFSANIVKLSSLLGSTIFLILIGITSKLIALYMIDLHLVSSHMISIYKK
tara:strand:- start:514 stop:945 length:432 start_codon:yes stop_codon:yes gene_type:complete